VGRGGAPVWGPLWGHGGSGPGYGAAVFHASLPDGRRATVSAACAIEEQTLPWEIVFDTLDLVC